MPDREKVLRGLECCIKSTWDDPFSECEHCPYNEISIVVQECRAVLSADALAMMKEQEAEWVEDKQDEHCRLIKCSNCGLTFIVGNNIPYDEWIEDRNYCMRCGAKMEGREWDA